MSDTSEKLEDVPFLETEEMICDLCNGTGLSDPETEPGFFNSGSGFSSFCRKCNGDKKLTWIENILGKDQSTPIGTSGYYGSAGFSGYVGSSGLSGYVGSSGFSGNYIPSNLVVHPPMIRTPFNKSPILEPMGPQIKLKDIVIDCVEELIKKTKEIFF